MVRVACFALLMLSPWLLTPPAAHAQATAKADAAAEADAEAPSGEARRQQVIVRGEGVEITVGEVEDALAQQGPFARIRYRTPDDLRKLVDNMVRMELLADEAERRGYQKHAAVQQTVKESAAQALVRLEVEDKVTPQAIPVADVQAYYEAHPEEFHRTAVRRASVIVLETPEQARELLPQAQKADARGFAALAKQHSQDVESKMQGGDLGYFTKEPVDGGSERVIDPAVRAAAFALKQVGDTAEAPVVVGEQHLIVRLTGERPERHASLEDAAPSIRAKLWRERRQQALDALVAKLRAREKPEVFVERIEAISFDDMEKRPTGFAPDPPPAAASSADASKQP